MGAIAPRLPETDKLTKIAAALALAALFVTASAALGHDVSAQDRQFVEAIDGPAFIPFLYLGAKHMVTGYDHVAFLIGVVFYLHRLRDVVIYVSMFTLGHSTTLLAGVLLGTSVNPFLIDAVIGLSVIYKAVENLGGFRRVGLAIDTRVAVLVFGLFHGLGLATKLQDLSVSDNGLLVNLIGFNVGVEVGQVLVLVVVVFLLNLWRRSPAFETGSRYANWVLVAVGVALTSYQLAGWIQA
jgi:hypothetical protein